MIKSLGPGLDTTDFIRIALGSQHTFIVVQNSNLSKPLVISWPQLLQQIQNQLNIVSGGSTIEVQDEGAIIDATAQFLNFVGAGVTVTQNGNGVDITIPGGSGTTPDLQQVTNVGATTTNTITVGNIAGLYSQVLDGAVGTQDAVTGTYAYIDATGYLGLFNGAVESQLLNTNVTNNGVQLEFPNKPTGTYTIATTADIPTGDSISPFLLMGG
jgi:hypothetical protein